MGIEDCRGLVQIQRHHQQCKKMMMWSKIFDVLSGRYDGDEDDDDDADDDEAKT